MSITNWCDDDQVKQESISIPRNVVVATKLKIVGM